MINKFEKFRAISLAILILITIEIFYFSSLSFGGGGRGFNIIPIIYHFAVFFLFAFFLLAAIKGNKKIKIKYILIVLVISIIQAFLDEIHQIFVPFRYPSPADILTDTLGIFSAILLYLLIEIKK